MAAGSLHCGSVGPQPGQPVFNVAGTRVGIQVIPANSTGPRVVVPTNAGAQALARQRVVARPLVYPDRQGAASVATTDGPSSQVRDYRPNIWQIFCLIPRPLLLSLGTRLANIVFIDFSKWWLAVQVTPLGGIEMYCVTVWNGLETAGSYLRKFSLLAWCTVESIPFLVLYFWLFLSST